ncbi:hypothetical protein [Rahnella aceris]|uniref:hypothetical protein n=1 Tax=Rahnella sp. (strain Y9602) TaxID=2703885 RepID=UPI003BA04D92
MAEQYTESGNTLEVMPERVYIMAVGKDGGEVDPSNHTQSKTVPALTDVQMTASLSTSMNSGGISSDDVQFKLYNLSPEMRSRFEVEGNAVIFRAGYSFHWTMDVQTGQRNEHYESLPVLFTGYVIHSYTSREGTDLVTTVYASTDKVLRAVTKTSIAYKPNTKRSSVVKDLASKFGLPIVEFNTGNLGDRAYVSGFSYWGSVSNALDKVCLENGLKWIIERGQLRVIPAQFAANEQVWTINSGNLMSLHGSFSRTAKSHPQTSKKSQQRVRSINNEVPAAGEVSTASQFNGKTIITKTKNEITCKLFLSPELKLGDCIQFDQDLNKYLGDDKMREFNARGIFRVTDIHHSLDYRGGDWSTELKIAPVTQE